MEIVETSVFTKQVMALVDDVEYATFQQRLAANPDMGDRIPGGGGIRKTRLAIGSKGKRGGARVIYYWAVRKNLILMLFAYTKAEMADLSSAQIAQLGRLVKGEFGHGNETF